METRRFILIAIMAIAGYLLWSTWQQENPAPQKNVATQSADILASDVGSDRFPSIAEDASVQPTTTSSLLATTPSNKLVNVQTDVLDITIDLKAGSIVRAELLDYSAALDEPQQPVILFNDNPETRYIAESTMLTRDEGAGDKHVVYQTSQQHYQLATGEDALVVTLNGNNKQGIQFEKQYTFKRGDYTVGVSYNVKNASNKDWQGHFATLLSRTDAQPSKSKAFVRTFFGASYSTPDDPYKKVPFKKMKKENVNATAEGGWAAMQQHYFLGAWIPNQNATNHYFSRVAADGLYTIGMYGPGIKLAPDGQATAQATLYVGPEKTAVLKQLAPHLDMTVDYGWLWFISVILFWLMEHIYNIVGNWGWSIILVTVIIKLCFYRLSAKSYRSMAAMRKLQPKLVALKERYGDDRQKMSQATMELYRKEKVNPFGGCLPILVQIPVFIALYWVLVESVELRQAPFIFWIQDLSVKDPFYILPLLMGLSMFIQQKLNPPPPDPTQAKVMMFLPVIFTALFMNFPSGLVLYWVVNNTLSIIQQWYITRKYGVDTKNGQGNATLPASEKS